MQFLLSHFSAPKKYFAGLKIQELLFSLVWEKDTLLVWKFYLFTRFIPWLVRLRWMSTSKPEGWRWEPKASGRHLERKNVNNSVNYWEFENSLFDNLLVCFFDNFKISRTFWWVYLTEVDSLVLNFSAPQKMTLPPKFQYIMGWKNV